MPKKHRLAYPNLTLDISRCFLFHNAGMNRIQFDEVLINLPMTSHVGRWPHWLSHVFFGGSWNHQPLSWAKTIKNLKSRWDPQFLRVDLCWFPLLWLVSWGSVFRGASPPSSAQTVAICKQLNDSWISGDGSTRFFGDELMKNLRSISKNERVSKWCGTPNNRQSPNTHGWYKPSKTGAVLTLNKKWLLQWPGPLTCWPIPINSDLRLAPAKNKS